VTLTARARILAALIPLACVGGCALVTNLDGFSGGADPDGGLGGDAEIDRAPAPDGSTPGADGGGAEGGADATLDARPKYAFRDDFARPDTVTGLGGNAWRERSRAFRLDEGTAVRLNDNGASSYRTNIATRPDGESVLDVDVSVEVLLIQPVGSYPQLHARVQPASLSTAGGLDSYVFFLNADFAGGKTFTIARQRGDGAYVTLKDFEVNDALPAMSRLRLRLLVTGTSPVSLQGTVEVKDTGGFVQVGKESTSDASPSRIETPGVVGISAAGEASGAYAYDNFDAKEP
jgi:hypothetical protein